MGSPCMAVLGTARTLGRLAVMMENSARIPGVKRPSEFLSWKTPSIVPESRSAVTPYRMRMAVMGWPPIAGINIRAVVPGLTFTASCSGIFATAHISERSAISSKSVSGSTGWPFRTCDAMIKPSLMASREIVGGGLPGCRLSTVTNTCPFLTRSPSKEFTSIARPEMRDDIE